jgi:hypothetical protein
MLFRRPALDTIRTGEVDLAFRRWDGARVRIGSAHAQLGRDTPSFKRDVRKLKELGLTESLGTGYRLSPRGHALIRRGVIGVRPLARGAGRSPWCSMPP